MSDFRFPRGEQVGLRMVRDLTDRLDNIDVFVEEHGAHAVLAYILHKWPRSCPFTGCDRIHKSDGSHEPLKGVVDATIEEPDPCGAWLGDPCSCRRCGREQGLNV